MSSDAYAAALLAARRPDGHWGEGYYRPKWTSTHYTLLELRHLGLPSEHPVAHDAVELVLRECQLPHGGLAINVRGGTDACVNGMALDFCSWFGGDADALARLVDWLLDARFPDGGFNCRLARSRGTHSSHHTTVSVLEGLTTYRSCGYGHRNADVAAVIEGCVAYLLAHQLFRSHRTGKVIHSSFVQLHQPPRWHFDVLRGLEALAAAGVEADPRLDDALDLVEARRRPDGKWAADRAWSGKTHTPPREASPDDWVTHRAQRVVRHFRSA